MCVCVCVCVYVCGESKIFALESLTGVEPGWNIGGIGVEPDNFFRFISHWTTNILFLNIEIKIFNNIQTF